MRDDRDDLLVRIGNGARRLRSGAQRARVNATAVGHEHREVWTAIRDVAVRCAERTHANAGRSAYAPDRSALRSASTFAKHARKARRTAKGAAALSKVHPAAAGAYVAARHAVDVVFTAFIIVVMLAVLFWYVVVPEWARGPLKALGGLIVPTSCTPYEEPIGGIRGASAQAALGIRTVAEKGKDVDPAEIRESVLSGVETAGGAVASFSRVLRGAPVPTTTVDPRDRSAFLAVAACAPCPSEPSQRSAGTATPERADLAAAAILAAGASTSEAVDLVAIAGAESDYNATARNPSSSARGFWQILDIHGLSEAERFDPFTAARKALALARERNGAGLRSHWAETYGKRADYLAEAREAVERQSASAPLTLAACEPDPRLTYAGAPLPSGPVVERAIAYALAQRGKPYEWGAAPLVLGGPEPSSYDCSSLVDSAYLAAGVDLPGRATTRTLIGLGSPVTGTPERGDLVFARADLGHVGIALGDGTMIHAPRTGDVVKVSPIRTVYAARRISPEPHRAA